MGAGEKEKTMQYRVLAEPGCSVRIAQTAQTVEDGIAMGSLAERLKSAGCRPSLIPGMASLSIPVVMELARTDGATLAAWAKAIADELRERKEAATEGVPP
jgi:hypothetical protein